MKLFRIFPPAGPLPVAKSLEILAGYLREKRVEEDRTTEDMLLQLILTGQMGAIYRHTQGSPLRIAKLPPPSRLVDVFVLLGNSD